VSDPSLKEYGQRLTKTVRPVWFSKVERLALDKDPQGRCLCSPRRAVVEFTIDRSGSILACHIVQSSEVGFVDQSALEAMNEVGQVKDPPASIFGDQPSAKMAIGFTLALDERFESWSCDRLRNPHESILGH
jgi:TonB family protein